MLDLKVNQQGDIELTGTNDFERVEGYQETSQYIRSHLRVAVGEWFLDPTLGFDYFGVAFKKQWDEDEIRGAIYEALEDIDEIDEIEGIDLNFDNANRKMTINLKIVLTNGEQLNDEVVI